jgi:3-phosphoshikimate 1-carboxyvinyltransferase
VADLELRPSAHTPAGWFKPPGSKSLTNRALVTAALAAGTSHLGGALVADDTRAMRSALRALRIPVAASSGGMLVEVAGCCGRPPAARSRVDAQSAGTVARFMAPVLALAEGSHLLDGSAQLRGRPLGGVVRAMRELGVEVACLEREGCLPIRVRGAGGRLGTHVRVSGSVSSQFASGLLLSAPCLAAGLTLELTDDVVSRSYVEMTIAVMRAFGARVVADDRRFVVEPTGYGACDYAIEPDASAASYFFGAAAITGGRVSVPGLGSSSVQGDLAFVSVLERMGCAVRIESGATHVAGPERLRGVDVDMSDLSDTAQTLAAIAPFAETPTRIRGIGFIRRKESDRVGAVVRELRRAGVEAHEEADGMVIKPGAPRACRIETYEDHRMAMSFALLGLRTPGLVVADAGCVAKTYPDYFADLEAFTGLGCSLAVSA